MLLKPNAERCFQLPCCMLNPDWCWELSCSAKIRRWRCLQQFPSPAGKFLGRNWPRRIHSEFPTWNEIGLPNAFCTTKKQNRYKSRYLDACGNFGNLCHDLIGVSRPQMKRGSFVNDVAVPRQGTNRIPNVPNDRIFIWDAVPIRKKWSNENKKRKEPNKTRLIMWDGPREILCTL